MVTTVEVPWNLHARQESAPFRFQRSTAPADTGTRSASWFGRPSNSEASSTGLCPVPEQERLDGQETGAAPTQVRTASPSDGHGNRCLAGDLRGGPGGKGRLLGRWFDIPRKTAEHLERAHRRANPSPCNHDRTAGRRVKHVEPPCRCLQPAAWPPDGVDRLAWHERAVRRGQPWRCLPSEGVLQLVVDVMVEFRLVELGGRVCLAQPDQPGCRR